MSQYFYAGTGNRKKREERGTGTNLDCSGTISTTVEMHGCRKKRKVDKQRIVIAEFLNAREGQRLEGGGGETALRKKAINAANPASLPDVPEPSSLSLPRC